MIEDLIKRQPCGRGDASVNNNTQFILKLTYYAALIAPT